MALATAKLVRGHAQPGTGLAATGKTPGPANGGCQDTGGQQPDAVNLIQLVYDVIINMPVLELLLALDHALFIQVNFGQDDIQRTAQGCGLGLINPLADGVGEGSGRGGSLNTSFIQEAT